MPPHTTHKAEAYMTQVEDKIRTLLREYSDGKLNSGQFHVLYERYSSQRLIAQQAMLTGDEKVLNDNTPGEKSTIAIKDEHMGKAIGLRIYHNQNGAVIETLARNSVPSLRTCQSSSSNLPRAAARAISRSGFPASAASLG